MAARKLPSPALLVIRPWLGHRSAENAIAHFDALAMVPKRDVPFGTYGALDITDPALTPTGPPRLHGFRFRCRIGHAKAEAYDWIWGYLPEHGGVFTVRDALRTAPSMTMIERGLARARRDDGETQTVGHFVARLARVLNVGGVAILDTSPDGSFHAGTAVRATAAAPAYDAAAWWIDRVVQDLHEDRAARVNRAVA